MFAQPAAAATARIQVGSNCVAAGPQLKCVGSMVQADGGAGQGAPEEPCSAGQVFRLLQATRVSSRSGGPGVGLGSKAGSKVKFYKYVVLPRLTYGAAEPWALMEAQGVQLGTSTLSDLGRCWASTAAQAAPPSWMDTTMHGMGSPCHMQQIFHETGRTWLWTGMCGGRWSAGAEVLWYGVLVLVSGFYLSFLSLLLGA